ncbi:MAG TPA: ATP-binding protein [Vicinamibacterales bacterium]
MDVLVFAPVGRDAQLTQELLSRASISSVIFGSIEQLCLAIDENAAAIVLTEEVFEDTGYDCLARALRAQPPWSEIAVLLFAGGENVTASPRTVEILDQFANITMLDRPIRVAVAISIIRAAIRARRRQLELRDLLVALEAARARAEDASRLKDEFLATLSHELRTPLNAILGWTTMLRHGEVDPTRVTRALEVIDRNARAQTRLIEDVLDMARVITGKLHLEMEPVSVRTTIEGALEAVRPAAGSKGVHLRVGRWTGPSLVRADPNRLQQVFWNLLSNAVKFTPPGGTVSVEVEEQEGSLVITVADTGIGLDPAFLPFVFDRFRQADQSVTRGHGGLGLGLAIVKQLVELHGGYVEAHSPGIDHGTTFRVVLPRPAVNDVPPEHAPATERDAFRIRLPGRHLLVVDDDAATRELLAELFEHAGAQVRTADSAMKAFDEVQRAAPDLMIADIGMKGEDGCTLMRRIRQLPAPAGQVPSIALSAYTRQEDRESTRAAGFTDFVGKPAAPQDLLIAVQRLLG